MHVVSIGLIFKLQSFPKHTYALVKVKPPRKPRETADIASYQGSRMKYLPDNASLGGPQADPNTEEAFLSAQVGHYVSKGQTCNGPIVKHWNIVESMC